MKKTPRVLLIGWDSADWRILDPLLAAGRLPSLASLVEHGCRANLATVTPVLSPAVWTSAITGKLPFQHGVLGFIEPDPSTGGVRPTGTHTRNGAALWNILSHHGLRTHCIGWFASHPAEPVSGTGISDLFCLPSSPSPANWQAPAGSVYPESSAAELAPLRLHPAEIRNDDLLPFLNNPADLAHTHQSAQDLLAEMAGIISRAASQQALATHVLASHPWDFACVYFRALDEFCHHFMPFHPPAAEGTNPADVTLFARVITTACEWHDMMLHRLLQLAGPDTTVILASDHGFESAERRPGPHAALTATMAQWHRPFGILAMTGPGITPKSTITGASILDLTPTILDLFGLPAGADMHGKILVDALTKPACRPRIPSWDFTRPIPGDAPEEAPDLNRKAAILRQLAALGYVKETDASMAQLASEADAELRFARISSLTEGSQFATATTEASQLATDFPRNQRFQLKFAQCLIHSGQSAEAARILDQTEQTSGSSHALLRIRANLLALTGHPTAALSILDTIPNARQDPAWHQQRGITLLQLRLWPEAETAFRHALAIEPDNPGALVGLAGALTRLQRDHEAIDAVLHALELQYWLPAAHFRLGSILAKTADFARAITSFETGLLQQPGNRMAHRYLASLYAKSGHLASAAHHRAAALRATPSSPL
jgi:predicted AlkP superfamily phosphohydrolase/phosphomutase/tetratricopeptide (TPR) repeat protein